MDDGPASSNIGIVNKRLLERVGACSLCITSLDLF